MWRHGDAGFVEDGLHQRLVHADGAGGDATADVGQAGQLEHALQGAVLAVLAVDQREDDVDLATAPAAAVASIERLVAADELLLEGRVRLRELGARLLDGEPGAGFG